MFHTSSQAEYYTYFFVSTIDVNLRGSNLFILASLPLCEISMFLCTYVFACSCMLRLRQYIVLALFY